MASLKEKQKEKEEQQAPVKESADRTEALTALTKTTNTNTTPEKPKKPKQKFKDKSISVKISSQLYADFTAINQIKACTNNGKISEIIADYVRDNKYLLNE